MCLTVKSTQRIHYWTWNNWWNCTKNLNWDFVLLFVYFIDFKFWHSGRFFLNDIFFLLTLLILIWRMTHSVVIRTVKSFSYHGEILHMVPSEVSCANEWKRKDQYVSATCFLKLCSPVTNHCRLWHSINQTINTLKSHFPHCLVCKKKK